MKYEVSSRIEVVGSVDILNIVKEYVPRMKQDEDDKSRFRFDCPICGKKDGLVADTDSQTWFCHNCMNGGDAVSLISKMENESEDAVLEKLAEESGIKLRRM